MKTTLSNGHYIAAGLLLVIFGLILTTVSVAAHIVSKPGTIRYVCADFSDWREAKKTYEKGASYLDGDNDGIPCEELYNKNK